MNEKEKMYLHWFCFHAKISPRKKRELLKLGISPQSIYEKKGEESSSYFTKKEWERFLPSVELKTTKRELEWMNRNHGWMLYCTQKEYPERLKEIYDYPLGLYGMGEKLKEDQLLIAMVGARDASPYGVQAASEFASALAKQGVGIVSGLARGIDACSHKGALEANGHTIGVLGCGIDICYPRSNQWIYEKIKRHGTLLSEFPLGTPPLPAYFPQRNRIISGLCQGIFVVEAKRKSGSLITANFALEQGRDIFALPGRYYDEMSEGCGDLILQGAKLVYEPKHILEEYDYCSHNSLNFEYSENFLLDKNEKLVYDCLRLEPKHINEVVSETSLSFSQVAATLTMLEMRQIIVQVKKNYYRRKTK